MTTTSLIVTLQREIAKKGDITTTIITGTYPIGKNGLLQVKKAMYSDDDKKCNIIFKKNTDTENNNIIVACELPHEIAEKDYNWSSSGHDYARLPWYSNESYNVNKTKFNKVSSQKCVAQRVVQFKGGNSLSIRFDEACEYKITIPESTDIEMYSKSSEMFEPHPEFFGSSYMNSRKLTTKYSRKCIDDEKREIFSGTYPLSEKSFVRLFQQTNEKINVEIKRCKEKDVIIIAKNKSKEINKESKTTDTFRFDQLPWQTTALVEKEKEYMSKNTTEGEQFLMFKGGNRMDITIIEEGSYEIIVPYDSDIKTHLGSCDVEIKSIQYATYLHVDCLDVNICGDSGFSSHKEESWTYYSFGSSSDPLTHITTKGKVILPTKKIIENMDAESLAHVSVWSKLTRGLF